jgi:hypothetical protein
MTSVITRSKGLRKASAFRLFGLTS